MRDPKLHVKQGGLSSGHSVELEMRCLQVIRPKKGGRGQVGRGQSKTGEVPCGGSIDSFWLNPILESREVRS